MINVIVFFTGMFAGMMMTLDDRSNYKVRDAIIEGLEFWESLGIVVHYW